MSFPPNPTKWLDQCTKLAEIPDHLGKSKEGVPISPVPALMIIIPLNGIDMSAIAMVNIATVGTAFQRALNTWPDPPPELLNLCNQLQAIYTKLTEVVH